MPGHPVSIAKTLLNTTSQGRRHGYFHRLLGMWMCYCQKIDPIVFGKGQRLSEITEDKRQNLGN